MGEEESTGCLPASAIRSTALKFQKTARSKSVVELVKDAAVKIIWVTQYASFKFPIWMYFPWGFVEAEAHKGRMEQLKQAVKDVCEAIDPGLVCLQLEICANAASEERNKVTLSILFWWEL